MDWCTKRRVCYKQQAVIMYSAKSRTESGAHPAIGDQQCNVMLHAVQKASSAQVY